MTSQTLTTLNPFLAEDHRRMDAAVRAWAAAARAQDAFEGGVVEDDFGYESVDFEVQVMALLNAMNGYSEHPALFVPTTGYRVEFDLLADAESLITGARYLLCREADNVRLASAWVENRHLMSDRSTTGDDALVSVAQRAFAEYAALAAVFAQLT